MRYSWEETPPARRQIQAGSLGCSHPRYIQITGTADYSLSQSHCAGPLWKKKQPSIIMSGQMGILAQLKASDPHPGAVGLDGVEVMRKGVMGTCHACVQPALPFGGGGVSVFLSDPKSFADGF